jgi:hypothetical protein
MGWNGIGWFVAAFLGAAGTAVTYLFPSRRESGYVLLAVAALCLLGAVWGSVQPGWPRFRALQTRIGTAKIMLLAGLAGIVGSWIFLTFTLAVAAWMVADPASTTANESGGPLKWYTNLEMEGGPPLGRPVFSLTFMGGNASQKEVSLKTANIVSAINGTQVQLEIIARDDHGKNEVTPIKEINLIPPGAPIRLVATFGDPDPNAPGKILGLDPKIFLDTWRQFYLNIEDDSKSYKLPFNEGSLMAFFPGIVGPHVTRKAK